MIITVTYFDGKSAKAHQGTLTEVGDTYLLRGILEDSRDDFFFSTKNLEVDPSQGEYLLTAGRFTIVVQKDDFRSLKISKKNSLGQYLKIGTAGCLALLFLYLNRMKIIEDLSALIPDSLINQSVNQTHDLFKKLHCLSKEQDSIIEGVFLRLGKNKDDYSVYVIRSSQQNAYAMPGNIIVFHDSLLTSLSSMEGFAGVLAHETAHLDQNHIKKKVVKDLILDAGFFLVFNHSQSQALLKKLAKGSFSQEEEREADLLAMANLKEAEIDSESMVKFFSELKLKETRLGRWLSLSHPDYDERITTYSQPQGKYRAFKSPDWTLLKKGCKIINK